jgi:CO dehydrogenase maturation factor
VAGTLARVLGRCGPAVLAIDADTNPNLALTLGLPREMAAQLQPVPHNIVEQRVDADGQKFRTLAVGYQDVMARYSVAAPDNTRLLLMARVNHGGAG